MLKKTFAFFVATIVFSMTIHANAHIMNKHNAFDDLAYSKAADDIVLLAALNMVTAVEGSSFYPNEILTMEQLAIWVANYYGEQGESSEQLAQAALNAGYVTTLEDNATYEIVNSLYFGGTQDFKNPEATMTHEQFAQVVASNITPNMLEQARLKEGPSGIVEAVETIEKEVDGKTKKVQLLTIEGEQYELTAHPYVLAESVDPAVWVGERLAQSYYSEGSVHHNEHTSHVQGLQLLVIGEEKIMLSSNDEQVLSVEHSLQQVEVVEQQASSNVPIVWVVTGIVAIIVILRFIRKKK